jgi:hypothetical protein
MFLRFFTVVGVLIASLTLAATAAYATDEPKPAPQAAAAPCVDTMKPLSRLKSSYKRDLRRGVIRGVAIDQGCGANGAGKLKSVRVGVMRKVGKRCQHLLANGRFGKAGSCSHVWLKAKGTAAWTFKLRTKLKGGKYLIGTSAVDAVGNVEARTKR